jgi:hypothetical protein
VTILVKITKTKAISFGLHAIYSHDVAVVGLGNSFNKTVSMTNDLNRVSLLCDNCKLCTFALELLSVVAGVHGLRILGSDILLRFKAILGQDFDEHLLVLVLDSSSHGDHD